MSIHYDWRKDKTKEKFWSIKEKWLIGRLRDKRRSSNSKWRRLNRMIKS